MYRPPNELTADHEQFLTTAQCLLDKLLNYTAAEYKIIASDLNYGNCYCKHPILNQKPLDSKAPDLFSSYGLTQLIDIPTRVTEHSITLIDLIYVNKPDDIDCHGTLPQIADHDGVLISFNTKAEKESPKTKIIYDYNNADINGLIDYIKQFDFQTSVFSQPVEIQTQLYTDILADAFSKFVPSKTITLRPTDQPWCNAYTRLLLRKKNRNYLLYKKVETEYKSYLNKNDACPIIVTKLLNKTQKALKKSRTAANESIKANRRTKEAFHNSVNATLNNNSISAKKKFSILLKLMKNNKNSTNPPLVENDITVLNRGRFTLSPMQQLLLAL